MKDKLISIFFHKPLINLVMAVLYLILSVFLIFICYSNLPESIYWLLNIIFNISGLLVIAYIVYVTARLILIIGQFIEKDDSMIKFIKGKLVKK